jgi:citrate/tricarballylate utilization protein
MPPNNSPKRLIENAIWQLEVCNACRYCEGYCGVFTAMERRRSFKMSDVYYLANLCHDCRACYYACMYTPPHEFAVNIPQVLSEVRRQTYSRYALPRVLADLAKTNFHLVALVAALSMLFFVAVVALTGDPSRIFSTHAGPGAFYAVIPYAAMVVPALVITLYGATVLAIGTIRFWRETRGSLGDFVDLRALIEAAADALNLRYMRGGEDDGCYYPSERASRSRYVLHMLAFWGFVSAFAATVVAFISQDFFGMLPPYPLLSLPVVLGMVGGIAMIVGTSGLIYLKWRSDLSPADREHLAMDYVFLVVLVLVSVTGMLLLALRDTPAVGTVLIVHLATIFALYVSAPYSKFAHFVYRYAALVQNRIEARKAP